MMSSGFRPYRDNWTEYQWEKELRRDERRISYYFAELPLWIDLPGEDEAIYDGMLAEPDLVPSDVRPEDWAKMWYSEPDEPENDAFFSALRRRPHYDMVEQIDKLCTEWNILYASRMDDEYTEYGLSGSCLFAKVLTRIADMIDSDEHSTLRISLAKRAIADINELTGLLMELVGLRADLANELLLLNEILQQLRERTIEILNEARRPRNP